MTADEIKQLQELVALGDSMAAADEARERAFKRIAERIDSEAVWNEHSIADNIATRRQSDFACAAANARPALAALLREHAAMKAVVEAAKAKYEREKDEWIADVTVEYDAEYAERMFLPGEIGMASLAEALEALAKEQG